MQHKKGWKILLKEREKDGSFNDSFSSTNKPQNDKPNFNQVKNENLN